MGFDLHGIKPIINIKHSQEYSDIIKTYGKDGWLDWSKDIPEFTKKRYFELQDEFRENNPGEYFRNNVWSWRPLWNYVCEQCQDFLSVEDMSGGSQNSGHKISKTKSIKISKRLYKLESNGILDETEREISLMIAKARAYNEELKEQMDVVSKECKEKHGKHLFPANYPEPYHTKWKTLQSQHDWDGDYPFDKENVIEFAKFCKESGGFSIC